MTVAEKELDVREKEDLINALDFADTAVYKTYLTYLNQMDIVPCPADLQNSDLNDFVRFFKVERFVYEKKENNRDKMVSVFHSVASCGGSIIVLIDSDGKKINYYFGTKVAFDGDIAPGAEVLSKSLAGNFPGTKINAVTSGSALNGLTDSVFKNHQNNEQQRQVYTISGVAGLRSKEENQEKLFIQGIEKLVDSMRGETYSLLLIADPVSIEELQVIKRGYENLYSQLIPFACSELNYGQNESVSISNSITEGLSKSINKSVADTLAHTKGTSDSFTEGTAKTKGVNISGGSVGALIGIGIGSIVPGVGTIIGGLIGGAIGGMASFNSSTSKNESSTYGTNKNTSKSRANTEGATDTTSTQKGETDTASEGTSRNIQLKFENKAVKNLLDKIDLQLKRLDTSADTGMWNCSVYCLADNASTCKIVASSYQSLLRGENSSLETGTITEWTEENVNLLLPWLEKMHHPKLWLSENEITPTSFISGAELTIHAGIPQSGVGGLPVLEMASFGREVSPHWQSANDELYGNKISLGKIYHMGDEEELPVTLNKKSLTSHTFITGSTGSGKSNTVYKLLSEIKRQEAAFLVIEPAKGEYKNVFGKYDDVSIYGANPSLTPLLRINPFVFPNGNAEAAKNIHILEHLDRLVEIFNVCWPMYAAMPAVLKDAIEVSYEEAGWDLALSTNFHVSVKYPSFVDVYHNIRRIIDSSEYSDENKSNYKGALITRLKSLSNGIYGLIFTAEELTNQELFDKNVIVDLSRVGSIETKALIMGILIMKLQEHRMTSGKMNSDLKHVTVLEEAHNLLKRASTEQISESANILGKSVEMLANAIAEMRTYGEGFIIADQSPGLLDLSVIRNTNTKILLHLPEKEDRELAGKAASLNDDQIEELAKLQCGVAAVYQNNWLQGVLCKVDEFTDYDKNYRYEKADRTALNKAKNISNLKRLAMTDLKNISIKEEVEKIDFADFKAIKAETIVGLFSNSAEVVDAAYRNATDQKSKMHSLYDYLLKHIEPSIANLPDEHRDFILNCIIEESCKKDISMREISAQWHSFLEREVR
jgi:hypothetical protein